MSKKNADILAAAMALLKESGRDVDIPKEALLVAEGQGHDYRNKDAVVVFANHPPHFKPKICKECNKTFAVNRNSVGFCSDTCRHDNWRRTTGLQWGAVSTHDVWNGDPPMIITPDQLRNLRNIVDWFSRNQTVLETTAAQQLTQEEVEDEPQEEYQGDTPVAIQYPTPVASVENLWEYVSLSPHTNLLDEPDPLGLQQNAQEEDDPFGF